MSDTAQAQAPLTPAATRILDAASELFYREGFRAIGVDTIVELSGVSKNTLYKHFGSKDELGAAFLRRRDERWRAWLRGIVEEGDGSAREKLLRIFDALEGWMADGDFRGCAFINVSMEIADPDHPARVVARVHKEWMLEYLAGLAAEAGAGEPEEAAGRLLVLIEGATVTSVMLARGDLIRHAKALGDRLIAGFRDEERVGS